MMFGNPETTTGGNALKFYSSVRIEIRPSSFIKDGDQAIGRLAKVKVVKNKVAPPFMKAEFELMFGEGISKAGEIIDMAVEYGIVKKSGAWFSYNGNKLGQGRDAVKKVIKDNQELSAELEKKSKRRLRQNAQQLATRVSTLSSPGKRQCAQILIPTTPRSRILMISATSARLKPTTSSLTTSMLK